MRSFLIVLCIVMTLSCEKRNSIELEILNDSIFSNTLEECKLTNKNICNVLKLKLTNNKDTPQLLFILTGSYRSFPKKNSSVSYNNIIIKSDVGEVRSKVNGTYKYIDENYSNYKFIDSLEEDYYKKILIDSEYESIYSLSLKQKYDTSIILYPKEVRYIDVPLFLPFVDFGFNEQIQFFNLKNEFDYRLGFKIKSDSTGIRKYLSETQKLNLDENNISIYHGEIISKNDVPIKFISEQKLPYWQLEYGI